MKRISLAAAWLVFWGAATARADWPQWLGPNRNGIAPEAARAPLLPTPQVLWNRGVGVGVSSVVVRGGRVYATGHVRGPQDRGQDSVSCLDAETGVILWTYSYECLSYKSQDVRVYGPRSTPTADGERLFTLSLEGHLFCFETASGKVLWHRDLVRDLNGRIPVYGYCCSPLIYRDKLILELNAKDAVYVALDKTTGEVLWRLADGNVTCGSPVLTRIEDADCVVFMGGGAVLGVNPATGAPLWRHATWGHAWMGPVVEGNRIFVANASLPRGCGLIRIQGGTPAVVWEDRAKKFQTLHCNSVIWQGHLYGFDNTGTDYQGKDSKKSSLKCMELETGRVRWAKSEMGWGNLIVHDGKLIILRETGELVVAKASSDAYEELTRMAVLDGQSWTVPAPAEGRLYCRNNAGVLVCLRLFGTSREIPKAVPSTPTPKRVAAPQAAAADRVAATPAQNAGPAAQNQWPRFRGPGGLGVMPESPASPKTVLWRSPIPLGGESSPVVWDQCVFLTGASKTKHEVYCFHSGSGQLLWQKEVTVPDANLPREAREALLAAATPVIDGQGVYAIFGNGDVACLDFQGEVKWSRNLGTPEDDYGHATSLAMRENLLFVQLDQGKAQDGKSKLLALASDCGRTVWEVGRPVSCSWSSPILIDTAGAAQLITCAEPWVTAYEPATGREIWRAGCLSGQIVSSPIYANGLVYVVGPDSCLAALRPEGRGDVTKTHVVWTAEENLPSVCSPVCNGELLWLVDSGGIVTCHDARTGQRVWEKDLGASFQASPIVVGDRLYAPSDSGTLFIIQAARQYALVGRIELGESCQASPAFHQGRLYVRTKRHLVCLGDPAHLMSSDR